MGTNINELNLTERGFEGRETFWSKKEKMDVHFKSKTACHREKVEKYIQDKTKINPTDISVKLLKTYYYKKYNNLISVVPCYKEML